MKNMKLPEALQTDIRDFMLLTQNLQDNQRETNDFIEMLSPSLRKKVMDFIFISAFKLNDVFKDEMKVVNKIISGITPFMQRPDDVVIWIDSEPDYFYFIAEG